MTASAHTAPTIDATEIDRFRALASDWWDPKGRMRPLHEIAPARLSFVRAASCRHFGRDPQRLDALAGLTALDIGCAAGLVSEPVARMGARVTGIDPGAELIEAARTHAALSGTAVDYRNARTEDLVAAGERFDLVLCLEVIEHVPDPRGFLATCTHLLAPGGLMIVSTLNRTMKSYALAIVGAEHVLRWLPAGTHDWSRFVTPDELTDYLAASGLVEAERSGLIFDPLGSGWRLSRDCGVNYMLAASAHST